MKKQYFIYAGGILAAIIAWYFFLRKKNTTVNLTGRCNGRSLRSTSICVANSQYIDGLIIDIARAPKISLTGDNDKLIRKVLALTEPELQYFFDEFNEAVPMGGFAYNSAYKAIDNLIVNYSTLEQRTVLGRLRLFE